MMRIDTRTWAYRDPSATVDDASDVGGWLGGPDLIASSGRVWVLRNAGVSAAGWPWLERLSYTFHRPRDADPESRVFALWFWGPRGLTNMQAARTYNVDIVGPGTERYIGGTFPIGLPGSPLGGIVPPLGEVGGTDNGLGWRSQRAPRDPQSAECSMTLYGIIVCPAITGEEPTPFNAWAWSASLEMTYRDERGDAMSACCASCAKDEPCETTCPAAPLGVEGQPAAPRGPQGQVRSNASGGLGHAKWTADDEARRWHGARRGCGLCRSRW
jgi:hypothetical protein